MSEAQSYVSFINAVLVGQNKEDAGRGGGGGIIVFLITVRQILRGIL